MSQTKSLFFFFFNNNHVRSLKQTPACESGGEPMVLYRIWRQTDGPKRRKPHMGICLPAPVLLTGCSASSLPPTVAVFPQTRLSHMRYHCKHECIYRSINTTAFTPSRETHLVHHQHLMSMILEILFGKGTQIKKLNKIKKPKRYINSHSGQHIPKQRNLCFNPCITGILFWKTYL